MVTIFTLSTSEDSISRLEEVTFDPLPIGESSRKQVWIHASEGVDITIEDVSVSDIQGSGTVTVTDFPKEVEDGKSGSITIESSSIRAETLNGISATIEVKAEAIIEP